MNEFIKKLIGRLEELKRASEDDYIGLGCEDDFGAMNAYGHAIEIVNKLAEECAKDTNIQTIDVSELLGEQVNDGWIPCSERLPEQTEPFQTAEYTVTMRFVKNGKKSRPFTSHASFDFESEKWLIKEYEVIAWREQIAPYQPKGE